MTKRYAVLGDLPAECVNNQMIPGGAGAIALALRRLGGDVTLRSRLGNDALGTDMRNALKAERIHPRNIEQVEGDTRSLTRHEDGSVTNIRSGVLMTRAATVDVYDLFAHDALVLDLRDRGLRRFIIDLPAHTDATVKMVSTLSFLDEAAPDSEDFETMMRCDTIVGTEDQFKVLTDESTASAALGSIFEQMSMHHLRSAVAITSAGFEMISRDTRILRPVDGAVPALLVAQVAAGMAWALAHHASLEDAATICLEPEAIG